MKMNETVKSLLESQPFAVVCLSVDLGNGEEALLLVKSSTDLIVSLREASAPVQFGWVVERTERGPALCSVIRVRDEAVGELAGEVYFDPADEADRELLKRLSTQARLRAAFLDENLGVAWLADIPWDEVRRLQVEQVCDRAEELLERTEDYSFEEAKALFQDRMPLGRILQMAFPKGQ